MATPINQTIGSLETRLGPKGGETGISRVMSLLSGVSANNIAYRADMRLWLIKNGISETSARHAPDNSMAKAYCIPAYLRGWRKRVNPDWDLLGGDSDDDEVSESITDAAEATGLAQKEEPKTTTLVPTKAQFTQEQIKELFSACTDVANKVVDKRLDNVELKITDRVAGEIGRLAKIAAEAKALELAKPRTIEVKNTDTGNIVNIGLQHELFPSLLRACSARDMEGFRLNIWMTGPTASGKTTASRQVSRALESMFANYKKGEDGKWTIYSLDDANKPADLNGLSHDAPFGADSALDADYKVIGFKDGYGTFHWTTFLRVFVYGGVYLADEIDSWSPSALLALNAALANGWISTPIGMLQRHKDCIIIAGANTWGLGATNDYVGRTKVDAATLNRFVRFHWTYDDKLELAIAQERAGQVGTDWRNVVVAARQAALRQGLKIVISPRATYYGISLLEQGFSPEEAVEMTITSGLSPEQVKALGIVTSSLRSAVA